MTLFLAVMRDPVVQYVMIIEAVCLVALGVLAELLGEMI